MALEETLNTAAPAGTSSSSAEAAPAVDGAIPEKLDELGEINFLLEEIESKIAPLALA